MFFTRIQKKANLIFGVLACPVLLNAADIAQGTGKGTSLLPADRSPIPQVAPASTEGELAMKGFTKPPGFKIELFAAEPMLANPVSFAIDEKGRFFVSETHRYRTSVLDIRHYMWMLEDDLACRTVEDRAAMIEKYFGSKEMSKETEIVRLVEDTKGTGKADFSSIYADGFNSSVDGIASGVMARKGKVWFTNIPELWQLEGIDKDGKAVKKTSLSHGYGVHFSLTGHDMHGLIMGPDGKIYFSFGDRGANVKTKEGKMLEFPDEGAVFRCNPDGSEMEVFAHGLRNPQELAFDNYGNLFTGDNDSDLGDHERWVYVVEGSDTGWRIGYQNNPMGNAGMWNMEKLWVPHFEGQAAYIIPPLANIGDGPSGLVHNPGTSLPAEYDDYFFLCLFKGAPNRSGIEAFKIKPKGAAYEVIIDKQFIWGSQATDVDFGPDGAIYFSDWGQGWERNKKGRLYKAYHTESIQAPIVAETKKLINEGMDGRGIPELMKLIGHKDQRVRREAQFALVEKDMESVPQLNQAAASGDQLRRIHAIWALRQISQKNPAVLETLLPLLKDSDEEIRAQLAKVFGDRKFAPSAQSMITALEDVSLRVRFFAAISLGNLKYNAATGPLLKMIAENNDKDQFLRHAGVMGLQGCAGVSDLLNASTSDSKAVRLAVLLVMRHLQMPEIGRFVKDKEPFLVAEAARAINDAAINTAMPDLAALSNNDIQDLPLSLRVVNANFRVGTEQTARALAEMANKSSNISTSRVEALYALGRWATPPARDRIVGIYRPLPNRTPEAASEALKPVIANILNSDLPSVQIAAAIAVETLKIKEAGSALLALIKGGSKNADVRVAALNALGALNDNSLSDAIKIGQADASELVRNVANKLQAQLRPGEASVQLAKLLETGTLSEKQNALVTLGTVDGAEPDTILSNLLKVYGEGKLAKELELDMLEAAGKRKSPAIKAQLQKLEAARNPADPLAPWAMSLLGGNAAEGKKIFLEKPEASCLRCHKLHGEGGEVGPELSGIGTRKDRRYILESIVFPNATIAQGFENLIVTLKNGISYAGQFKSETDKELVILSPEDGLLKLDKATITKRDKGLSGMPEGMGEALTRRELRSLVEFLATEN
ncbi:MAG: gdhB 1 [Verrucomicrobiales bacterium]|nr:gdhB 1 [Verrucomicrobiales bacterium]